MKPVEKMLADVVHAFGRGPPKTRDSAIVDAWRERFFNAMREAASLVRCIEAPHDESVPPMATPLTEAEPALDKAAADALGHALNDVLAGTAIPTNDPERVMVLMFDAVACSFTKGVHYGRANPEPKPEPKP